MPEFHLSKGSQEERHFLSVIDPVFCFLFFVFVFCFLFLFSVPFSNLLVLPPQSISQIPKNFFSFSIELLFILEVELSCQSWMGKEFLGKCPGLFILHWFHEKAIESVFFIRSYIFHIKLEFSLNLGKMRRKVNGTVILLFIFSVFFVFFFFFWFFWFFFFFSLFVQQIKGNLNWNLL